MVLYADVLFLIDFSMDVLTLWTAGKLTHSELKAWRVALSAAFGALVSVIATALGAARVAGAVISAVSALVMTFIAFGPGKPSLIIRRYIFLWLGGILLGGVMTALMSAGKLQGNSDSTNADLAVIPMGVLLLFVLVSAIIRTPKADHTFVTLGFRDRSCDLRAICDSGNLLSDPFSGESVILIKKEAAAALFSDSDKNGKAYTVLFSAGTYFTEQAFDLNSAKGNSGVSDTEFVTHHTPSGITMQISVSRVDGKVRQMETYFVSDHVLYHLYADVWGENDGEADIPEDTFLEILDSLQRNS